MLDRIDLRHDSLDGLLCVLIALSLSHLVPKESFLDVPFNAATLIK
jgi:hypothetical protein